MADVNAIIRVDIDASAANAGLASMASQMQKFNKGMIAGSAAMNAAQIAAANRAQGALNRTGQWIASTGSMMTAAGRMHKQFDKGTMASWQQWRDTSAKTTRAMGQQAVMTQMAAGRVRALQTQYTALGREVEGTQKYMKAQPTGMLKQWGADAMFAHEKAVLFNRRMQMGANSMINWGKNTQWAGRQMMVGMGIPLGIAAVGAVRSFKDIEQASISFKRVYGDATTSAGEKAKMLGTIQEGVAQDMTKYGIAVSDTLSVAAKAAATGQKGDDLVTATRETMRLATLGQIDYDQALESTIATQTAFGVSSKGMVRVTDFLNAAENQTILSMDDMTKAIPRVAPVIRGLGGDIEDLGVLMTALRAGGVTAEQGANALKSGLGSLINPTSGATEAMEKFGIPLDKIVNANKGDLIGTVQDFGKALNELPKFDQQQALEALFGKYQYARMGALFKNINSKQAKETARLSEESSANLAKMSENELSQISDSALNKFQGAVERLKAAAAPLGEAILSILAPIVDFGANILGFFNDNSAAAWAAGIALAFAGVAGVVTMLTGVFANFAGTMAKGALAMRSMGRWAMRKPSLRYNSIDDLEAAAAQRQLSAAADGATASLYGEKGAVNQLTAALNAMNAELRESVGLQAASAGGPPVGGGGRTRGTTAATAATAADRQTISQFRSSIAAGADRAHVSRPINLLAPEHADALKKIEAAYGPGTSVRTAIEAAKASGKTLSGKNARFLAMDTVLNTEMDKAGGKGVKGIELASDATTKSGDMYKPFLRQLAYGAGVAASDMVRDPAVQRAVEGFHKEYVSTWSGMGENYVKGEGFQSVVEPMMEKHFGSLPGWDATGMVHQISGDGLGKHEVPRSSPEITGWRESLAKTSASMDMSNYSLGQATDAQVEAVTKAATETEKQATQTSKDTLSQKQAQRHLISQTNAVAKERATVAKHERTIATGMLKDKNGKDKKLSDAQLERYKNDFLPRAQERLANAEAALGRPTGVGAVPTSQSAASLAAHKRLTAPATGPTPYELRQMNTAGLAARGGRTGYEGLTGRDSFANIMGSRKGIAAGVLGSAWGGTKSFFGSMSKGGVFDRSPEKMDRMMGGLSNKLMGMGMAAEMVTMGLMMSGKEIPIWGHLLGTGLMTMGMFPEAVQKPIDMIKAGGSKVGALLAAFPAAGVALGGFALAAGALGANFLYHKKITDDAIQSGQDLANAMSVSSNEVSALGEQYGNQSIVEQKRAREAAKVAGTNVENMTEGQKALQSDVGKKILEDATKVMEASGIEESARTVANKLATANLQGTMDYKDTKGFLGAMGEENSVIASAARREYGKMVTSSKMVAEDPVGLALKLQETTNRSAMATATKIQSQARVQQEAYQAGGSYSSYSGMYGGGGGSGGNLAVDSPALGAINSKYAGFQGTIWSAGLEQQVTNREAAMIRLQDIERQMNDPSNTNAETSMLSKQFANGTEQLKKFDAQAQASWDNMKTTWGSTSEDGKNVMLSSMDQSARDRATDPMSQAMTEMGIQKMYDFRNNGDSTGEKITQDVQFRVTSALASGALNPDALTRMLDMGSAGANKIDLAISGTSSLNEAGDFFNKISSFKPGTFKDAVQGIGDGFIKAAKYAGMTQKEAMGLSKALGGSQADINAIKKAFQGDGVKGNPGKSRDNGNKDGKAYKDGAKNSSKGAKGDGVKGNPGKSKGEGNKDGKSYKDGANKSSKGAKGDGVKGNPGKSSGAGGKDGDAYTKAMMSKIKQISGVSVEPKVKVSTAGIGASIGAVASKAQNVKINYVPGDMPPPPDAVDQPINRVVAMDMSIIPPLPMTQMIMRFISFDMSTIPPFPMTQMIMRFVGFDASVIPPPPVTQLVIRKTVGGSVVGGPVGGFADGGDPFKRRSSKISGRGGPKDDLIPTMLSNGEFVIRASSVNKYGTGFMNKVNRGQIDRDVIPHLSTGDEAEDSKKKSKSKDSKEKDSDKEKDKGWKDLNKSIKDLAKTWKITNKNLKNGNALPNLGKVGKGRKKRSVLATPEMMSALLATDSPNALKNFFARDKKARVLQSKLRKQINYENTKAFYDQYATDSKTIKANSARLKMIKKNGGLATELNAATDEEVLAYKALGFNKKKGRRSRQDWIKTKQKVAAIEYSTWKREQDTAQTYNTIRNNLSNSVGSDAFKMTDEEAKRYAALNGTEKDTFYKKQVKTRIDSEKRNTYFSRLQELADEKAYANRFNNSTITGSGLNESDIANLSQEDFATMLTLTGDELKGFAAAVKAAGIEAENMAMSQSDKNTKLSSALDDYAQTFIDQAEAQGKAAIIGASGMTQGQLEARNQQDSVISAGYGQDQTVLQREIDDVNKAYDAQLKILDKVAAAQTALANLEKARLGVASALSQGDIAGAAAAAQEARSQQAQFAQEQMRQGLEDEREAKIKERQDKIDELQDKIDDLNDKIFERQQIIDKAMADAGVGGADAAAAVEKQNVALENTQEYWNGIRTKIFESVAGLREMSTLMAMFGRNVPAANGGTGGGTTTPTPTTTTTDDTTGDTGESSGTGTKRGDRINAKVSKKLKKIYSLEEKAKNAAKNSKNNKDDDKFFEKNIEPLAKQSDNMGQRVDRLIHEKRWDKAKSLVGDISDNKKALKAKVNKIADDKKKKKKKANAHSIGGWVPGTGSGDTVPSFLTPGEYVLSKDNIKRGAKFLETMKNPSYSISSQPGMLNAAVQGGGMEYTGDSNTFNVTVNVSGGNMDANAVADIAVRKMKDLSRSDVRRRRV